MLNIAIPAAVQGASVTIPPDLVQTVEISRYAGKWHEIGKIPNFFQRRCVGGTTATYTPQDNGTISVVNQCTDADGDTITAQGTARPIDPPNNTKLEVSFVRILGFNLFWGDYWIIGLDEEYSMAVIGHPKRKYAWILARTPSLSDHKLAEAFAILKNNGYELDRFEVNTPKPMP